MQQWMHLCTYAGVHVCRCACVPVCLRACKQVGMYAGVHVCLSAGGHVNRCAGMQVCMHAGVHMCKCARKQVCLCAGVHVNRCACIHVCRYAGVHVYRCACVQVHTSSLMKPHVFWQTLTRLCQGLVLQQNWTTNPSRGFRPVLGFILLCIGNGNAAVCTPSSFISPPRSAGREWPIYMWIPEAAALGADGEATCNQRTGEAGEDAAVRGGWGGNRHKKLLQPLQGHIQAALQQQTKKRKIPSACREICKSQNAGSQSFLEL